MKAQLSVEMLVVLVIVLGVAILLASAMFRSANSAAEKIEKKTNDTLGASDAQGRAEAGEYCGADSDCKSQSCDEYSNRCL